MALTPVKNFAKCTVSTGYSSAATTIILSAGHGSLLPATFPFPLVWWNVTDYADPADDPNVEIVSCTNRVADTLTITRAQEGTSASNKNLATKTYMMALSFTAALYNALVARNESWLGPTQLDNASLSASVASNALTVSLKTLAGTDPSSTDVVRISFPNTSDTNGLPLVRTVTSALSLTVSNGSSLGATASVKTRLYVGVFDNAGSVALGIWNPVNGSSLFSFLDGAKVNTTAEGGAGAADSPGVIYTASALTGVCGRYFGYLDITPGGAFAWSAAPTFVRTMGPGSQRTGDLLQRIRTTNGTFASGTTLWSTGTALPTSTYGDSYMSVGTTMQSTMNCLYLRTQATWSASLATQFAQGFLAVGASTQVGVCAFTIPSSNYMLCVRNEYALLTGTTATGWSVRAGGNAASTFYFNGPGGALWSNTVNSWLELDEIQR